MRLSRWGRSPYETHEDIREETDLLSAHVDVIAEGADAEIVVVNSTIAMGEHALSRAPSMQLLVTTTSGWDHIDTQAFRRAGVAVCRLPEARRDAVVEATLGMLIWGLRRLGTQGGWSESGLWGRGELPVLGPISLGSARVGVVGLGVIGQRVASMLNSLGSEVWGTDPRGLPDGVRDASIDEMIGHCHAITFHCDLNSTSAGLLSAAGLEHAHPRVVVVNTARGGIIDVNAACDALIRGELGALALDVFPEEPYPGLSRSAQHPEMFFTPHAAGYHQGLSADIRNGLLRAVTAHLASGRVPYQVV